MENTDTALDTRSRGVGHWLAWSFLGLAAIGLMIGVMYLMGRPAFNDGGAVKFWYGVFGGPEQSQQFLDWYSFTHILHGPLFFFLLWLILKKGLKWHLSAIQLLVIAIAIEVAWEIFENSDFIINRYRTRTIDRGYTGDTILNSLGDVLAMILGFIYAQRFSVWATIGLFVLIELTLLIGIKDNLTLNIIMLIYPVEAIKQWQISALTNFTNELLYAKLFVLSLKGS